MIDPVTAISIATNAFGTIKRMVAAGRDVEDTLSQIGRWYGAVSDLNECQRRAENPPLFKKIVASQSVEQEAMELFTQKKQLENQRDELRKLISSTCGPSAWQELIKMERDIRKQRKETIYKQREARKHFIEVVAVIGLAIIIFIAIVGIAWLFMNRGSL